jgi:uncharacterized protein YegP (UPF0339 family)
VSGFKLPLAARALINASACATKTFSINSTDNCQLVISLPEPKFEWFKDKAGKFRFRLLAANGEIIATSEGYSSKDACVNGIESVKKNAPIAKIIEAKA